VTGFGLIGHACEVAQRSSVRIHIDAPQVPIHRAAARFVAEGVAPEISGQTLNSHKDIVEFVGIWPAAKQRIYADPQTNGGLLITMAESEAHEVVARLLNEGFAHAAVIGHVTARDENDRWLVLNG